MMLCVMSVAKIVKFLLGRVAISQYIAVIVLRKKEVEIAVNRAGETLVIAALTIEIQEDLRGVTPAIVALHSWLRKLES